MAGRQEELWDANRGRDSIHVYVECEENDGYEDELEDEEEIPLELSSLAPTDEWYAMFTFYFRFDGFSKTVVTCGNSSNLRLVNC